MLDGARNDFDGDVFDSFSRGPAWDVEIVDVRCPVWLWYGDADVGVGPDHGRSYGERIPTADLTIVPGGNHPTIDSGYRALLPRLVAALGAGPSAT